MKKIIYLTVLCFLACKPNLNNLEKSIKNKNQDNIISSSYFLNSSKTSSNKTNVILTLIIKYSWETILPFMKSLKYTKFGNYDIIIFVQKITQSVINHLKSFGAVIYEIPFKIKTINEIYSFRWKLYSKFLENNKNKYNIVLSVDIRDTIIQKEFFNLYENYNKFLAFSFEDANLTRLINNDWIINTFGIKVFKSISHQRTINAGTIWGSSDQFLEFSNILYKWLLKYPEAVDQSVVNYLIYHEKILKDCIKITSDEYGPVITLGLNEGKRIHLDSDNNILNYRGQIASIVHQYDRHRNVKRVIKNKFCPELNEKKSIRNIFILSQIFIIILISKKLLSSYKTRIAKKEK